MKKQYIYTGIAIGLVSFGIIAFINRKRLMKMVWDYQTEQIIQKLHPDIRQDVRRFINKAASQGYYLRITEGCRSYAKQAEIYNAGDVKAAPPGLSYHQYCLAFDVVEMKDGVALWQNPNWDEIGAIGESLGFKWGGDFDDKPHFEKSFGYSVRDLLTLYEETGHKYLKIT